MKEKKFLFAAFLNFTFWGLGYFYLNKPEKGILTFTLYTLVIVLSMTFIALANPLIVFPIIFWIILWSLWCSFYIAYDAYENKEEKITPLKIKTVKVAKKRKHRKR
jgi:glucan phosphoethanolaminetransferase (alkaline phosphatase superfamily)